MLINKEISKEMLFCLKVGCVLTLQNMFNKSGVDSRLDSNGNFEYSLTEGNYKLAQELINFRNYLEILEELGKKDAII